MSDIYVISLQSLMEEALAEEHVKYLTGNVKAVEELFSEKNMAVLKRHFQGIFAFLGFHPKVDTGITSYICSGSISSNSGSDIMVLFTLNTPATSPVELENQWFKKWIELETSVHPSYTITRNMFMDPVVLPFPGIIFFEDFLQVQNPIYIHITESSSEDGVRQQMRLLFALAEKAYNVSLESGKGFLDTFALNLQKNHLPYERGRDISAREWFVNAFRIIGKHFGDIVSVVQLFKP